MVLQECWQSHSAVWRVIAEIVNMAESLDEDEEAQFLQENADLIPLGSVEVALITAQMAVSSYEVDIDDPNVKEISGEEPIGIEGQAPKDDLQTILEKERAFEAQLSRVTRVQEDALETMFLGQDKAS